MCFMATHYKFADSLSTLWIRAYDRHIYDSSILDEKDFLPK